MITSFLFTYSLSSSSTTILPLLVVDADGLRNFICNHGWVSVLNGANQSPDNYFVLANDNVNEMDAQLRSKIIHLQFVGNYGNNQSTSFFDFSIYQFAQVQSIYIGCRAFLNYKKIYFKSNQLVGRMIIH